MDTWLRAVELTMALPLPKPKSAESSPVYNGCRHFGNPGGCRGGHHPNFRGNSSGTDVRLRLDREVLRNVVVLGFRLPKARFDSLSTFV